MHNTDMHEDIRADIGATDIGAPITIDIRDCTDDSTRTSVIFRISKRISARTVRPGFPSAEFLVRLLWKVTEINSL